MRLVIGFGDCLGSRESFFVDCISLVTTTIDTFEWNELNARHFGILQFVQDLDG